MLYIVISSKLRQNIWKAPVQVCRTLNCVLVDCSWLEAVNQLKKPDQFDLLSLLSSSCLCSKLFTEFILKVPVGRLVKQKLDCLIDIVHSDLFTHHGESTHARTHTHSACTFTHGAVIYAITHTTCLPQAALCEPTVKVIGEECGYPSCYLPELTSLLLKSPVLVCIRVSVLPST